MGSGGLALKRSAAHRRLLLATAAVVALLAGLVTAMAGHFGAAEAAAVRSQLTSGPATSAALRVQVPQGNDAADPSAEIRRSFARGAVTIHESARTGALPATIGGATTDIIAGSEPDLRSSVRLESGSWPTTASGPIPAAVQADAAAALGLALGDTVELGPKVRLRVAATWRAIDPRAAVWFADPAVATGRFGRTAGPFLVAPDRLAELPAQITRRWTIVPDAAAVSPATVDDLNGSITSLKRRLDEPNSQATVSGQLDDRLSGLRQGIGAARGLVAVPAALLGVIAIIAITALSRLLVLARARETHVLRARGASAARLSGFAAAEAAVIACAAALVGTLVTGLFVDGPIAWWWSVAIVAGAVLVFTASALQAVFTSVDQRRQETDSRSTLTGVAVLVGLAAALSLWQFLLYDGPLSIDVEGRAAVDPLTVWAPALVLLAFALLTVLALGPATAVLERAARHRAGLLPVLPARQVARRSGRYAMATVMTIIAVGGVGLLAGLDRTWTATSTRADTIRNGSDVRLDLDRGSDPSATPTAVTSALFAGLPGAERAETVFADTGAVDRDTVGIIARAGALDGVPATDPSGAVPSIVTRAFASRFDLSRGDRFSFVLASNGSSADAVVAAISGPIPGAPLDLSFSTDLDTLTSILAKAGQEPPRPNQVWIRTATPDRVAAAATTLSPLPVAASTRRTDSSAALIEPALTVAGWGTVGAVGLALLGIVAMTTALADSRRSEVPVLRALGLGVRDQIRNRLLELGGPIGVGVVMGLVAGIGVAHVTVPDLVRSSLPGLPGGATIEPWLGRPLLAAGCTVFVLGVLAIGALGGLRIRADTRDADYRELST